MNDKISRREFLKRSIYAGTALSAALSPRALGERTHRPAGIPNIVFVLTDQWYPGWEATVDDTPVEVLRADTVFRAVCVPEGQHTVTFRYRPASLRRGALISLAGWVALAVAWTMGRQKNRAATSDPNK